MVKYTGTKMVVTKERHFYTQYLETRGMTLYVKNTQESIRVSQKADAVKEKYDQELLFLFQ